MSLISLLKSKGVSEAEIKYIKKKIKAQDKTEPFASKKEKESNALSEYLEELQEEKASIESQIGGRS